MRTFLATLVVASLTLSSAAPAQASPTQVNVRIEGQRETLFEGPIWTEGHDVRASSDSQARPCDGTNNHAHATPGATPTAAAVDAMRIAGATFDAQWYGSSFDDYFLTRFGPDAQSITEGAYWGILVNNVFTNIGGCQYELGPDNEVLWVYDAFAARPLLALLPLAADYTAGPRPLTATAELGKPLAVEVINYADDNESNPPAIPARIGSTPAPGATVAPVRTATNGFERIETASTTAVVTDAQGKASITFTQPGWHRLKATVLTPQGMEVAVRSNRLDVCVPPAGQSTCGEPPAEDQVRTPPPREVEALETTPPPPPPLEPVGGTPIAGGGTTASGGDGPGAPVTVAPTGAGGPTASRAKGPRPSRAKVPRPSCAKVPRPSCAKVPGPSRAKVPRSILDDRWRGLHYHGHWQHKAQPGAWLGTVSRAGLGGRVSVRLGPGRPVFLLRGTAVGARVEVAAGSRREVFSVARGAGSPRLVVAAERGQAGTVSMRVLTGTVNLDGVAVAS